MRRGEYGYDAPYALVIFGLLAVASGVDASVAFLKLGANGSIDVNAARAPTVAFVMTNSGLMANVSLGGTKVTRIE